MQGILSLEEWTVADSKEQRDKWFIIYGLRLYCGWSMTPRWPSTREAWESAVDAFNSKNTLSAAAEDGVRQNTTLAAFFHSGSFSCLHNHSRRLDGNSSMFSTATSSDGSSFFRCWMASSLSRNGLYRKFEQLGLGWIVLSTTGWSQLRWESGSACRRPVNEKSRWCPSVRGTWSLSRSVVYCTIHCSSVMHCSYYLVWRQSQLHWQACYQLTSKLLTGRALWKNMKLNEPLAGSTNHTAAE